MPRKPPSLALAVEPTPETPAPTLDVSIGATAFEGKGLKVDKDGEWRYVLLRVNGPFGSDIVSDRFFHARPAKRAAVARSTRHTFSWAMGGAPVLSSHTEPRFLSC